jgi:DNA polymerase-1
MPNTRQASRALVAVCRPGGFVGGCALRRPFGSLSISFIQHRSSMPTLLLVDGSSYLYRAFPRPARPAHGGGEPTGAIRGVLSMLRVLEADYKSDYRAVVFDAKGKTFRDDWYPEYKAHRPSMPEDLAAQIAPLHECIRAAGWPLLMVDGVEADDVIGTLSRQATAAGIDCVISTGDKDLTQLVNPHVRLVNTMSNECSTRPASRPSSACRRNASSITWRWSATASDGIPGVPKVGPKTAVKWLEAWGSLDAIVAHAGEIGGAVGENLRKHLDFLPLGVKLVTVVCDLPLPLSVAELAPQAPDKEKLAELYARLEFKGWLRELSGEAPPPARPRKKHAVTPAPTPEPPTRRARPQRLRMHPRRPRQLDAWLARLDAAPLVSLDTETTDLDPMQARLVGISFAIEGARNGRLPAAGPQLCRRAGATAAGRNAGEAEALAGIAAPRQARPAPQVRPPRLRQPRRAASRGIVEDTLLQSYVLESDKTHDLGALAARHCGLATISYDAVTGKGANRISFAQVDVARAAEYAAEDADVTLRVHQVLRPQLAAAPELEALYRDLELPVAEVLFRIERNGVLIDAATLAQQSDELGRKIMALEAEAQHWPASPSTSIRPSSWPKSCSTSRACRW